MIQNKSPPSVNLMAMSNYRAIKIVINEAKFHHFMAYKKLLAKGSLLDLLLNSRLTLVAKSHFSP